MFFKVVCLVSVAVAVVSGHVAVSSQYVQRHDGPPVPVAHGQEHYTNPKYEFGYMVNDPHTGDMKSQVEHRDGDVVKGQYKLRQPDGSERHVDYYGDKHSGFHADVKYSTHHVVPPKHHVAPLPLPHPVPVPAAPRPPYPLPPAPLPVLPPPPVPLPVFPPAPVPLPLVPVPPVPVAPLPPPVPLPRLPLPRPPRVLLY